MRSVLLVNRWIATDAWQQVDIGSSDVTAIVINTGKGKVLLVNMYNDSRQHQGLERSIQAFQERLCSGDTGGCTEQIVWLGDFNLHHPLWDVERNGHLFTRNNLVKAQVLIDTLAEFDLQMTLPKDILTLQALSTGNHMRPANVYISSLIADHVIRCHTLPEERPVRTDHIPIVTEVDLSLEEQTESPCLNFRIVDWKQVREMLASRIEGMNAQEEVNTPGELQLCVEELTRTVTEVIEVCILKVAPMPDQKC